MSNQSTISTTLIQTLSAKNNDLYQVVNSYLGTVQTSKGATPTTTQKENFLIECMVNNLNPIKKQAYLLGYDTKSGASFSTIISISGFTSIAQRTGAYAGVSQPRWAYKKDGKIDYCSITVQKIVKGILCEFAGQAYMDERVQTKPEYSNGQATGRQIPTGGWANQPRTMLEKCAKASALRNAFPEELGDKYDEVEMPLVITPPVPTPQVKVSFKLITQDQINSINQSIDILAPHQNITSQEYLDKILAMNKQDSLDTVTEPVASQMVKILLDKVANLSPIVEVEIVTETVPSNGITENSMKRFHAILNKMPDGKELKATIKTRFNVDSTKDLTEIEAIEAIKWLEDIKTEA